MTNPTRELRRSLLAAVVAVGLPVSQAHALAEPQPPLVEKSFAMKYETGTEAIKPGARIQVGISPETIVLVWKSHQRIAIPAGAITDISYDTVSYRRSADVLPVADSLASGPAPPPGQGGEGLAALMMVTLITAAFVHAIKTTQHFVRLAWVEEGRERVVWLKVGKGEYSSFLASLEQVTGRRFVDRAAERQRLAAELRARMERFSIELDRKAWVEGAVLRPGRYQVVVLEREPGRGEVYFFAGPEVTLEEVKAASMADLAAEPRELPAPAVAYKDSGGMSALAEIQTSTRTIRFR
jgi:hypothetical protein